MPRSRRVRVGLLAAGLALAVTPVAGNAAEERTLDQCVTDQVAKQDPAKFALCTVAAIGRAVSGAQEPTVGPRNTVRSATDAVLAELGICDPIDPAACLLPFPNDFFTVADKTTATGRRVNFSPLAMPRNVAGKPIDPTEWNRNDGFSPGTPVLASVPGLDAAQTGLPPITDPARSLDAESPVVIVNARTGERHPFWSELDANPTAGEQPLLITRPAKNFTEGDRYVVGLRGMRDAAGALIPSSPAFAERRDDLAPKKDNNGKSKGHDKQAEKLAADPVFGPLDKAGVAPQELYLAWTFTVASTRNITERVLHMRDDAFASLGTAAPAFTVDAVTNHAATDRIARTVTGKITVPSYLTNGGAPSSRLNYVGSTNGLPTRLGGVATQQAPYTCKIPRTTGVNGTDPATVRPAKMSLYGHGLLGGQSEVGAGNVQKMSVENNYMFCATDWIGMATEDVPNVATILADMSNFPTLPDRGQQGFVNFLFLGRAMKTGFATNAAFQGPGGTPAIDTSDLFYDGNSQGGIMGAALMAVAQDVTRGVLGVPGMNYSTLLDRSIDFATYESVFNAAYPSEQDRQLVFGLIQMLWDRAEGNGYAAHITNDPLPNTPSHQVLLHVAFGDHQVANVSAEVEARTIGAGTNAGYLAPGRHWAVDPTWGIPVVGTGWTGSALVYWDSGSDTPPNENIPPTKATVRGDPHSDPRETKAARDQKAAWLSTGGVFVDVCNGAPCYARPLAPSE
ncbi:MAG TPA: hypothetical protein VNA20_15000 [Frankiaceae bacterium]|nr:hypothetical protein [Frankiaceae bacterium]